MRALIASFGHAIRGLVSVLTRERNGRIHLAVTIGILIAGAWLGFSRADWLWITLAIGLVVMAEAFNSAIETLCDTLHPDRSEGIGRTKDLAAGAVLAAAIAAAIIGLVVLWPHVFG